MSRGPKPHPPQPPVHLPGKLQHGTPTAYRDHGCRCLPCQTRKREYDREAALRRKRLHIPAYVVHGTVSTYVYWTCRCEPCKEARNSYDRERWETGGRQKKRNEGKGQES